jgi:hypothetical protein
MGGPARRGRSDLFLASREEVLLVPLLLVVRDARLLAPKGPVEKLSVASWPHSSRSRWSEDCASSPAPASRSRPAAAHLAPAPARSRRSAAGRHCTSGPDRRDHGCGLSQVPDRNRRPAHHAAGPPVRLELRAKKLLSGGDDDPLAGTAEAESHGRGPRLACWHPIVPPSSAAVAAVGGLARALGGPGRRACAGA